MKIKNKYTAPIGFGAVSVLPDEIKDLPSNFTEKHPIVKYYISRGWVEVIGNQIETKPVKPLINPLEIPITAGSVSDGELQNEVNVETPAETEENVEIPLETEENIEATAKKKKK